MRYSEFRQRSQRKDKSANDRIHFFSKNFSTPVAYICYRIGLSPNIVTFLFLIIGVASAWALYGLHPLIAYLFWRLHVIFDMADGDLARATKTYSPLAKGFDRSNHVIINTSVLLAPLGFSGSLLLANLIIVGFYLYYFFSRNFSTGDGAVTNYSVKQNFLKYLIGLEGYILVQCAGILLFQNEYAAHIAVLYVLSFFGLFIVKVARYVRP